MAGSIEMQEGGVPLRSFQEKEPGTNLADGQPEMTLQSQICDDTWGLRSALGSGDEHPNSCASEIVAIEN